MTNMGPLEAAAFRLDRLKSSQIEAVWNLLRLVEGSLGEAKEAASEAKGTQNQRGRIRNRRTRLVFWSGEAGVGKTSTYLSVRDWFESESNEAWSNPPWENADAFVTWDELRKSLDDLAEHRKRALWLEPIDLDLLAGRPNFLAAVAARVSDALRLEASDAEESWFASGGSEFREAQQEFLQLANDIALSWEGNLPARGASLEPDIYASEVMRAEAARLNVNRRFGDVVGRLCNAHPDKQRIGGPPIFVLPVDDFYLKPEVSLELLRFLRMISCPNLVVLMLGDIDTVEKVLRWRFVGEAMELMGGENRGDRGPDRDDKQAEIFTTASSLSSAALQKLIPAAQIVRMLAMQATEALNFSPKSHSREGGGQLKLDSPDAQDWKRVEDRTATLRQLLDAVLYAVSAKLPFENERAELLSWYWALALELPARQVRDFHEQLSSLLEYKHNLEDRSKKLTQLSDEVIKEIIKKELAKRVADRVGNALEEDRKLDDKTRDAIWQEMVINEFDIDERRFPSEHLLIKSPHPIKRDLIAQKLRGAVAVVQGSRIFPKPSRSENEQDASKGETAGDEQGETESRSTEDRDPLRPRALGWLMVLKELLEPDPEEKD